MTGLEIIAVNAAVTLVVGLIKLATRKKPEGPSNATREPSDATIVSDGTPIGAVFGTVLIEDPNVLCWFSQSISPHYVNNVVYGDKLRANVVFGLCLGPIDGLVQVELDGQIVDGPSLFNRVSDGPFIDLASVDWDDAQVNKTNLYGKVKGPDINVGAILNGVDGYIAAFNGLQTIAELTTDVVPTDTDSWDPSTQGAFSQIACVRLSGPSQDANDRVVAEAFNHGIGKTSLGRWAFWVERIMQRSFGALQWYDSKARIVVNPESGALYGMNPAHIVHELLTDEGWGLGLSTGVIDETSFQAAADTLYTENLGLCFRLNSSRSAQEVIDDVLRVIDAVLVETGDGTLKLKLIRELATLDDLAVIDESNASRVVWMEPSLSELPTSISLTYWSALMRRDRTYTVHNEANIRLLGRKIVQEVQAFGVISSPVIPRLASRELLYATKSRATVEIDVHPSVAVGFERGDAFVLDWPDYAEPTVFRVTGVDFGTGDAESIRVQAVEDVFHERGEWQDDPAESDHENPIGEAIGLTFEAEQLPYWIWDRAHGAGLFSLPDLISPTPPTTDDQCTVWQSRAIVYGERPRYDQSGFAVAEQLYDEGGATGVGLVFVGPQGRWTPVVEVRTAYSRNEISSADVHLLNLDATDYELAVGDVLRVPVTYPSLDFSTAFSTIYRYDYTHIESSYEFIIVVEVIAQGATAQVRVARGLFDTMPAPEIVTGDAYVVGNVEIQEFAGVANWFDANPETWQLNAGLTGAHDYLAPGAADGDLTVDIRALGATRIDQQAWGDVSSNPVKLLSEIDHSSAGGGFVARAARPIASGGCSVSESSGDYTIIAEARDRTRRILAPSGLFRSNILQMPSTVVPLVEEGRTFECHVFGDGVWLGVKSYDDAAGEFTVSAADLTGWGGPFTTIEFAILTVWKAGPPKPITSWSYTYLTVTP